MYIRAPKEQARTVSNTALVADFVFIIAPFIQFQFLCLYPSSKLWVYWL
jgi:hypothetical protein